MHRFLIPALAIVTAACGTDPSSAPRDVGSDAGPAFAKQATSGTDSRAQWYFSRTLSDGLTATRLYGDDRNLDGTTVATPGVSASGYDGEAQCAVRGTINWYHSSAAPSGDAFFGPAGGSTPLCQGTARAVTANLGSSILVGLHSTLTVSQVMQLAAGESRVQTDGWVWNQTGCARLRYDSAAGSGVVVTRASGNTSRSAGSWTVESYGTHIAACYNFTSGNKLTHTGPDYYLPFSATLVEILR